MRPAYSIKRIADVRAALRVKAILTRQQGWSREELERWQAQRLAQIVDHAVSSSGFYRDLYGGRAPGRPSLRELPVVEKADWVANADAALCDRRLRVDELREHLRGLTRDEYFLGEYRAMSSGGSSRIPGVYVFSRADWAWIIGASLHWFDMQGLTPRFPRRRRLAAVSGPGPQHMSTRIAATLSLGLHRTLRLDASRPLEETVAALNRFDPDVLSAYPSIASLLAGEQLAGRLRIDPRIVSTSSEPRTRQMADRITAAWGTKPFDCYATTETGILASDCDRHCGQHLFEGTTIVEIVDDDGRPVGPGETGARVLVTNLFNRTQPLIRFALPDRLTLADAPCRCGRPHRLVAAIEGRSDDVLSLPARAGGTTELAPIAFGVVSAVEGVSEFEIVRRPCRLHVRLVVAPGFEEATVARAAEEVVQRSLHGAGVDVDATGLSVEVIPALARDAATMGKVKLVRSEVGAPG